MAITKVWVEDGCIACGNCQSVAPEVFEVTDRSRVKPGADFVKNEALIKEAAEECPAQVIKYEA